MSVHADAPPPVVPEPSGFQYATGAQLGKGGFAICHRAELLDHNKPTGKIVALKIVKSKMEPPKLAQKFVTELQIHSKLHHPNIVEFYRAFSFEKSTYVVLEVCDNGSLADALKRRKYFTMPEIRRFIIQTCGAVKYLHHRNIIHRDLKTGNLFLDRDMNVKVGDFGLAAVLISKNDLGARRTTMCGTPNYLAPEILEKGGRGHDEKVDLWAIGIIAYTLAVGRAPFHAAKREDIYKKLQARDYKWPELGKISNDISHDLRDLVSSLLVHADERPDPDQIVSHAFFKLGFIPAKLDSKCTGEAPKWNSIRPPTVDVLQRGYTDAWYNLCEESGVGEYAPGTVFPVFGGRKVKSIVKDIEKELARGLQPVVPVPADTVYVPYPKVTSWPYTASSGLSEIVEEKESSAEGAFLAEITANSERIKKLPVRPAAVRPRPTRVVSHKENCNPPAEDTASSQERPRRIRTVRKVPELIPDLGLPKRRPARENRAASDHHVTAKKTPMVQEEPVPVVEMKSEELDMPVRLPRQPKLRPLKQERIDSLDLLDTPDKDPSIVQSTDPVNVLARVAQFRDNIVRALGNRSTVSRRPPRPHSLPYVSKWVDYSRKHGVGYVLEDGSIGCIMNATKRDPVTHIVVRNGYSYLSQIGKDYGFLDTVPFEYLADCGDEGIRNISVDKDRKRTTGILWAKFGRYMCQQLGTSDDKSVNDDEATKPLTFVRFYQRLGSVGIWGFDDGSFQFNFPDHTKLVLSPDGSYTNFMCLSVEAAEYLAENSELPFKYIRQRNLLESSVRTLLYAIGEKTAGFRSIAKANLLKEKLEFVVEIVDTWLAGGGLGCSPAGAPDIRWDGPQLEDGKKQEWVTVGRYGGDAPRE